jgi:hypothetical protein
MLESVSDFLVCCQVICRTNTSLHKNHVPASHRRPLHRFPGLRLPVADAAITRERLHETAFLHVKVWDFHELLSPQEGLDAGSSQADPLLGTSIDML